MAGLALATLIGSAGCAAVAHTPAPRIYSNEFVSTGSMSVARDGHTATLLLDGRVLVVGGAAGLNAPSTATTELYDPTAGRFFPAATMEVGRSHHTATLLPDGRVLVVGGDGPQIPPSTAGRSRDEVADLLVGNSVLSSAELYDPKLGAFVPTGSMTRDRDGHTATLLADGRVLIVGGDVGSGGEGRVSTAEIYDPRAGFVPTGNLRARVDSATATLLRDGRVLIAGGSDPAYPSAELYDPRTGVFSVTGPMITPRALHTATLLGDGRVLMVGGWSPSAKGRVMAAEVYDPDTESFVPAGQTPYDRFGQTAVRLTDGRVLIAGSYGDNVSFTYDPRTGDFTATPTMTVNRANSTGTLLMDGRVLFTGGDPGYLQGSILASAELYQ
jgi:hypothetical protein